MASSHRTRIANRYELLDVIGQGGQGVVYRARDLSEQRDVAVKMLTDRATRNPEFAARLAREQQAMIALAGTSAVAFYDLCKAPTGALCLVMELLEGEDLETRLTRLEESRARLGIDDLFQTIDPIVDTLERAHDATILHRDIKPANIFLLSEKAGGGVRLLDFGLSRMKTASPLTVVGTIIGSPSYIAPEVWRGKPDELDHRVDLYSLGVILFRALAGRLPFDGESLHDKFVQATTAKRPSLHELRRDLPRAVDEWVARALAIDPNERFSDVRALWAALLRALSYDAPARPMRPVTDSLVSVWRSAASAFRRFVERRASPSDETVDERASARENTFDEWIDVDDGDLLEDASGERAKAVTWNDLDDAVEIEPDEWSPPSEIEPHRERSGASRSGDAGGVGVESSASRVASSSADEPSATEPSHAPEPEPSAAVSPPCDDATNATAPPQSTEDSSTGAMPPARAGKKSSHASAQSRRSGRRKKSNAGAETKPDDKKKAAKPRKARGRKPAKKKAPEASAQPAADSPAEGGKRAPRKRAKKAAKPRTRRPKGSVS